MAPVFAEKPQVEPCAPLIAPRSMSGTARAAGQTHYDRRSWGALSPNGMIPKHCKHLICVFPARHAKRNVPATSTSHASRLNIWRNVTKSLVHHWRQKLSDAFGRSTSSG